MAVKSLTVTEDAYDALKRLKHGDESFSETILRVSHEKIGQATKYFGALGLQEGMRLEKTVKKRRIGWEKEFGERREKIKQQTKW